MDSLANIFLVMLVTAYVDVVCGSVAWNWVLGIPLASANLPVDMYNESLPVTNDAVMNDLPETILRRRHRHGEGAYCKSDSNCGRRMFCDAHYNHCRRVRKDGDQCREDKQCHKSSECVFGICRKLIKYGMIGAKCERDSDCDSKSCCAKVHGESICKSRLPQGHKCFVPSGGLDYSINEVCPCLEGLYCTYNHRYKTAIQQKLISEENTMRCTPFPVENYIKIV